MGSKKHKKYVKKIGQKKIVESSPFQIENLIKDIDTNSIIETYKEMCFEIRDKLLLTGEIGEKIWERVKDINLEKFIQMIGQRNTYKAESELRNTMFNVMSFLLEVMGDYQVAESNKHALSKVVKTWETSKTRDADKMLEWGVAVTDIFKEINEISKIENNLQLVKEEIISFRNKNDDLNSEANSCRVLFDGNNEMDGLFILSAECQNNSCKISNTDLQKKIDNANHLIHTIELRLLKLKQAWKGSIKGSGYFLNLKEKIDTHIFRYTNFYKANKEFIDFFGSNTIKPYEESAGSIIEKEVYQKVEQYLLDDEWTPYNCKSEIMNLIATVLSLINNEPCLTTSNEKLIEKLKQAINIIDDYLNPSDNTNKAFQKPVKCPNTISLHQGIDKISKENNLNKNRVQEIYEMVTAVLWLNTCSFYYYGRSTIRSVLRQLEKIGKISNDEIELYKNEIRNIAKNDHWLIINDNYKSKKEKNPSKKKMKTLIEIWKTTQKKWISFIDKDKNIYYIKLSKKYFNFGENLFKKHNLSKDALSRAKKELYEDYKNFKNKKAQTN